jgi:hypothetical protein
VGESLAHAVPEADGGYRDRISIPPWSSGTGRLERYHASQDMPSGQALGAYSVPGSECGEWSGVVREWRERALAAEGEVRALRAALSEALAAAGV